MNDVHVIDSRVEPTVDCLHGRGPAKNCDMDCDVTRERARELSRVTVIGAG